MSKHWVFQECHFLCELFTQQQMMYGKKSGPSTQKLVMLENFLVPLTLRLLPGEMRTALCVSFTWEDEKYQ